MNQCCPKVATEAEYLCRQGRTGIAIFATRMGHPQEFLWSFQRAGEVKFMKAPFLSSLLPWIVRRRNWKGSSPGLFASLVI